MGLDISVEPNGDSFRAGSYSSFHNWRSWLASVSSGVNLDELYEKNVWNSDMPFIDLLNHSDCDGKLGKRECKRLSKDFQKYLFIILNGNRPNGGAFEDDDNFAWLIQRYLRWKSAVDDVAEGNNKMIRFC